MPDALGIIAARRVVFCLRRRRERTGILDGRAATADVAPQDAGSRAFRGEAA